jgi:hypothetical protein
VPCCYDDNYQLEYVVLSRGCDGTNTAETPTSYDAARPRPSCASVRYVLQICLECAIPLLLRLAGPGCHVGLQKNATYALVQLLRPGPDADVQHSRSTGVPVPRASGSTERTTLLLPAPSLCWCSYWGMLTCS